MIALLSPLLISLTVTALVTPGVIRFARRHGLVDDPRVRFHPAHTHKGVIPRAGGLSIFLGITTAILLSFPMTTQLLGIVIGSVILTALGLLDDKKDVSPYVRLLINLAVAILVVGT